MSKQTVAVIGAGGTMGLGVARNLAKAGFTVRAWNRSAAKARPLEDDGATVVESPGDAVDGADVIVTVLFDANATTSVMAGDGDGALGAARDGATLLKLVVNSWLVALIEGMAEAFALADGLGLDPDLFRQAVAGGPLDVDYLGLKGDKILQRDFDASFSLSAGAKDAGLVVAAAETAGLELPVLRAIRDRLAEGTLEHGDDDIIATYLLSTARATAG